MEFICEEEGQPFVLLRPQPIRCGPPTYGGQSAFLSLLITMLISSRNNLIETSRKMFDQVSGHPVVKLTYKINHYILWIILYMESQSLWRPDSQPSHASLLLQHLQRHACTHEKHACTHRVNILVPWQLRIYTMSFCNVEIKQHSKECMRLTWMESQGWHCPSVWPGYL